MSIVSVPQCPLTPQRFCCWNAQMQHTHRNGSVCSRQPGGTRLVDKACSGEAATLPERTSDGSRAENGLLERPTFPEKAPENGKRSDRSRRERSGGPPRVRDLLPFTETADQPPMREFEAKTSPPFFSLSLSLSRLTDSSLLLSALSCPAGSRLLRPVPVAVLVEPGPPP